MHMQKAVANNIELGAGDLYNCVAPFFFFLNTRTSLDVPRRRRSLVG